MIETKIHEALGDGDPIEVDEQMAEGNQNNASPIETSAKDVCEALKKDMKPKNDKAPGASRGKGIANSAWNNTWSAQNALHEWAENRQDRVRAKGGWHDAQEQWPGASGKGPTKGGRGGKGQKKGGHPARGGHQKWS